MLLSLLLLLFRKEIILTQFPYIREELHMFHISIFPIRIIPMLTNNLTNN